MSADPSVLPPPLQDVPTAKEKKYDRQLRLWGASGQIALEESHILLINNGPGVTGVEALKNLVLPGIGEFTIADSARVTEADLGINFFLDDSSLGKFRAEETVRLLLELNPDVKGNAIIEPIDTFVETDNFFTKYSLIIVAAPLNPSVVTFVQNHARALQIPLFYLRSIGFYSSFSVLLPPAFPIVDTHPEQTATTDLRLLTPWPALKAFAGQKTEGLGSASISQHAKSHIPWIALLLHYLEVWKEKNSGKFPDTYKDKVAFRALVREGDYNEENFDEACANVLKTVQTPSIPSIVREIFAAPETQNVTATSPAFWFIAKAVHTFYEAHHELPLPGSVPDMKAQSADYVELQNIYKTKAREDCAIVISNVRQLEASTGRDPSIAIGEKEIENFCKGVAHISLVRGRPFQIAQPNQPLTFGDRAQVMAGEVTNPDSLIGLYIGFLAWDKFIATHPQNHIPGLDSNTLPADTFAVTALAHDILDALLAESSSSSDPEELSEFKSNLEKICLELVRAGSGELHNIASLTGGLLSQEVIKVVTRQYVPIDNLCLFDGITSKSCVLRI